MPDPVPAPGEIVTEHAVMMSGGGYHVRNSEPYVEEIYPLAKWIASEQRFGGKVYRRKVIVVEDWRVVPKRRKRAAELPDWPEDDRSHI